MAGLNTSLSVATQSLLAQEAALETANNNIANANTPGYARETVVLTESAPTEEGGVAIGAGVTLQGFTSVRDQLLELRIQQQTSDQSSADTQVASLSELQTLFPTTGQSLGTQISAFFTSLSALSESPTSTSARQGVLAAGQSLANQFHSISAGLADQEASLNSQVSTSVNQINQLSSQIAQLNGQIGQLSGQAGANPGPLQDQLSAVEGQLAKLTNVSVSRTSSGDTVTTGAGTALVLGSTSYPLSTTTGANGLTEVLDSQGTDITATISSGSLGGLLLVRDSALPGLQNQLDTLASQMGSATNAAQAKGFDSNGAAGGPLFTIPAGTAGAAAAIQVATTDPSAIAASSDHSSGGNGNVANLTGVESTKLAAGLNPVDASAGLVYQVGLLASKATANSSAIGTSLAQLVQQQSSTSGVSIDEESANLIRYQQAYEASARVISTISTLFDATINMGAS